MSLGPAMRAMILDGAMLETVRVTWKDGTSEVHFRTGA